MRAANRESVETRVAIISLNVREPLPFSAYRCNIIMLAAPMQKFDIGPLVRISCRSAVPINRLELARENTSSCCGKATTLLRLAC